MADQLDAKRWMDNQPDAVADGEILTDDGLERALADVERGGLQSPAIATRARLKVRTSHAALRARADAAEREVERLTREREEESIRYQNAIHELNGICTEQRSRAEKAERERDEALRKIAHLIAWGDAAEKQRDAADARADRLAEALREIADHVVQIAGKPWCRWCDTPMAKDDHTGKCPGIIADAALAREEGK